MNTYHKINGIYKRHREGSKIGQFIEGDFSKPEFEFLKDVPWTATEKVDGMNIRVKWFKETKEVKFAGKSDNADIPGILRQRLTDLFTVEKLDEVFDDDVCLYGEGYGGKIQKGSKYKADGQDFVLFDIKAGTFWLERENLEDVAKKLECDIIPEFYPEDKLSLMDLVQLTKNGFDSNWGEFPAEGLVVKPKIEMTNRWGERIITKLKIKDFEVKEKGGENVD